MSYGLSKSRLMAFQQCPKQLWLSVHRRDVEQASATTQHCRQNGFHIGEIFQKLHPGGVLIGGESLADALELTQQTLREYPDRPLFEAAFERDGVLVRADVLLPEPGGYRLREVKASTCMKSEYYVDCAIQAWVIGHTITLTGVELAHIDASFIYRGGQDYRGLLKCNRIDVGLTELMKQVPDWINSARLLLDAEEPEQATGAHCAAPYSCPFQDYCAAAQVKHEYPMHCLPFLQGKRLQGLVGQRITDICQIFDDCALTEERAQVA